MTNSTIPQEQQQISAPGRPGTIPLEEVIEQVRRDSRQESDAYLDETTVPHGGE